MIKMDAPVPDRETWIDTLGWAVIWASFLGLSTTFLFWAYSIPH